ncbi:MAG: nucleotidyltransferase domain-containing protein [Mailhella sp.]|nr:nucleotidyltransferase domain-containing protein [Mailhella sp.]
MLRRIIARLNGIERQHGVRVLYACESGSRAWGMASEDSDFDVRFIYAHEREWYLTINPDSKPDVIDAGIEESSDGILDCNGWDVRKSLKLLQKSNGGLLEWLNSPIVYKSEGSFADDVRFAATQIVSLTALWHHYRHLRDNSLELFLRRPTAKVWLYALRPQLAMLWIEKKQTIPPMEFLALVDSVCPKTLHVAVAAILEAKRGHKESDHVFAPEPALEEFINMEKARGNIAPLVSFDKNAVDLDLIFRNAIK